MASGWFTSNPVLGQRADSAPVLLAPIVSADEYLVVLVNAGRFDWLRRKDDLLDEGVAAVFGLASGTAELLGLCFHRQKFPPLTKPRRGWPNEDSPRRPMFRS